jgi:hypothetical protein
VSIYPLLNSEFEIVEMAKAALTYNKARIDSIQSILIEGLGR